MYICDCQQIQENGGYTPIQVYRSITDSEADWMKLTVNNATQRLTECRLISAYALLISTASEKLPSLKCGNYSGSLFSDL